MSADLPVPRRVLKCAGCEVENSSSSRFCTQCGVGLPIECVACRLLNAPASNFCGECGADLTRGALSGRPPKVDAAGPPSPRRTGATRGERRHLTVLFSDIVGSTLLAKSLDPEDLNDLIRAYYDCCKDAITGFDGIVANYIGDGVMALFGYPRAHEDDAERAIHAALRIARAHQGWSGRGKVKIQVRVGIASGCVVVGEDGDGPLTKEKTVVGETPNLAARLRARAEPNGILISESSRRLIGDIFRLGPLEPGELQTGGQPVTAWRVVGDKVAASRFAAHVGDFTSFVGRPAAGTAVPSVSA